MVRALTSTCLALLLLGLGGATAHAGKPQIAILGLEVTDTGQGIDPQTTNVAKELTNELRQRAKAGTGQYAVAPGSEKELIDEKLLKNCDNELPACMAAIGVDLGAEMLMYGRIERSTEKGQPVYKVYIKLMNVARKQMVSTAGESIPVSGATTTGLAAAARAWYGKLTGQSDGGTLVVKANTDRGTVLVDEDEKGTLSSGTVTIGKLAEGRHTLAIEAQGYERYEATITVRNGETISHGATLIESKKGDVLIGKGHGEVIDRGGTVSHPEGNGWRTVAIVSGIFTVAGAATYAYTAHHLWSTGVPNPFQGEIAFGTRCDDVGAPMACAEKNSKSNDNWGNANIASGIFTVAAAGVTVFAFIKSRHSGTERADAHVQGGHRVRKREFAVTPVVTPQGGGATLQFDW